MRSCVGVATLRLWRKCVVGGCTRSAYFTQHRLRSAIAVRPCLNRAALITRRFDRDDTRGLDPVGRKEFVDLVGDLEFEVFGIFVARVEVAEVA